MKSFTPNKVDSLVTQIAFAPIDDSRKRVFHFKKWFEFYYDPEDGVKDLVAKLNSAIAAKIVDYDRRQDYQLSLHKPPKFLVNLKGKVELDCAPASIRIEDNEIVPALVCILFGEDLQRRLGFDYEKYLKDVRLVNEKSTMLYASLVPEKGFSESPLIFIYTDILREHPVGDTMAPVLRVVPFKKKDGSSLTDTTFANPHYYAVKTQRLSAINVLILDETGSPIRFGSGKVLINLHFRKCI